MFEIKWPIKLEGITISVYLIEVEIRFNCIFGIVFLIFLIFSKDINDIETKNATIMLLTPINGVNKIKQANKTSEPIM